MSSETAPFKDQPIPTRFVSEPAALRTPGSEDDRAELAQLFEREIARASRVSYWEPEA